MSDKIIDENVQIENPIPIGKKIGTFAFIVSEILVILGVIQIIIGYILKYPANINDFSNLLLFQGVIFATVWGSKASSNFADALKLKNEGKK